MSKNKKNDTIIDTQVNRETIGSIKEKCFTKGFCACAGVVIIALIVALCLKPQNIPFVVQVDPYSGKQTKIPNAVKEMSSYTAPEWLMSNMVQNYIKTLRSVSSDSAVNREKISEIYYLTTGQAKSYVGEYYNNEKTNPVARGEYERVEVTIYNCLPINTEDRSKNKFQVDWSEIIRDVQTGNIKDEKNYRADIDLKQYKASKMTSDRNPLGFYIQYIYISEINNDFIRK